jgi:hypothetical protein
MVEKRMIGGLSFQVNGNMCRGLKGMAMDRVGTRLIDQAKVVT